MEEKVATFGSVSIARKQMKTVRNLTSGGSFNPKRIKNLSLRGSLVNIKTAHDA